MKNFIYNFFKLKENKTNIKTELIAGATTFITMSYIIIVNPTFLSSAGIDKGAATVATCLAAAFATTIMALYSNYPFALAPGMGINAYFAISVVNGMGIPWEHALGAVFISGIIFMILNFFKFRSILIASIPEDLQNAISAGIGCFIAYIGLQQSGLLIKGQGTQIIIANINNPTTYISIATIILIAVLSARKIKGAVLFGILFATVAGIIFGISEVPQNFISMPPSIMPSLFKLDIVKALDIGLFNIIFVFLFVDIFDTSGTFIGLGKAVHAIDKKGNMPNSEKAFFADAAGTIAGSLLGTSTTTTYIESSAGISEGGKTGLTGMTVAGFFILSLFFYPLISIVPVFATASALIVVGTQMIRTVKHINWSNPRVSIPCFFVIFTMPLTSSIAMGMSAGFILYSLIEIFSGEAKKKNIILYVLALIFAMRCFLCG